jgi:hypothetical protein
MTPRVTVTIDEVLLDGLDERTPAAELVRAEVARALARQPAGPTERVAAEVGRAVEGSVRP